mgnify:CR=1 FL=1
MRYLVIISLFIFIFLYLSIYIDLAYLFGFTSAVILFFYVLIRNYFTNILDLLDNDKKMIINKETAEDHPIIKSARSRLKE